MAEQIGAKFRGTLTNDVAVLITPAENVNGAVIRTATMNTFSGNGILSTGTTAPFSRNVANVPVILSVNSGTSNLSYPVVIPAGYGLWAALTQNGAGAAYVTYDLLP